MTTDKLNAELDRIIAEPLPELDGDPVGDLAKLDAELSEKLDQLLTEQDAKLAP
ncbi:MAG TPA: hypothetical protein VM662_14065 [Sphingomonas sp.]|nr:hypothetical protein [Sphingomonas sp.]